MKNTTYRIVPVPPDFAASVRAGRIPSVRRVDPDPHQCRRCLTLSKPGEPVRLVSYSPFTTDQPYAERGPIFLHERECDRDDEPSVYPRGFPKRGAAIRAYDSAEALLDARVVGDSDVEEVIARLLANPRAAFLHARNVAEGCYMFRIEAARGAVTPGTRDARFRRRTARASSSAARSRGIRGSGRR